MTPGDADLRQANFQLLCRDQAVPVTIKVDELIPELVALRVLQLPRDDVQQHLLQGAQMAEGLQPLDVEAVEAVRPAPAGRRIGGPSAMQRLLGAEAGVGVDAHELPDEILGVGRNVGPDGLFEAVARPLHVPHDLGVRSAREGWGARQQDVHHDTSTPHVAPATILPLEDLGCDVVRGAHHGAEHLLLETRPRRPEVDELQDVMRQGASGLHKDVLGLHIAMDEVQAVHVSERPEGILHDGRGPGFAEAPRRHGQKAFEELTSCTEFHDEEDLLAILESLVQPDQVRMVKLFHDGHFLIETLDVAQQGLRDRFDGTHFACALTHRARDLPIGTLAQLAGRQVIELLNVFPLVEDELRPVNAVADEGQLGARRPLPQGAEAGRRRRRRRLCGAIGGCRGRLLREFRCERIIWRDHSG
mmetsp:Transcript_13669/g.44290  ORF Transcript_13669/g.44290 Transcript_13669/m.44290 type:complete len:417 (-) Transcript_13669:89-1339(-)